jgi:hypothetical protein
MAGYVLKISSRQTKLYENAVITFIYEFEMLCNVAVTPVPYEDDFYL